MNALTHYRLLTLAAALGAALTANAVTILIQSSGNATITATTDTSTEMVKNTVGLGAFKPLTNLTKTIDLTKNPKAGTAAYTGAGGQALTLNLVVTASTGNANGTTTISGTWTYKTGTGDYAKLKGSGTWAQSVIGPPTNGSLSGTQVIGTLDSAVPEPSALGAVALGVAGILRRRKKT